MAIDDNTNDFYGFITKEILANFNSLTSEIRKLETNLSDLALSIKLIEKDLENRKELEEKVVVLEREFILFKNSFAVMNTKLITYSGLVITAITGIVGSAAWFILDNLGGI